MFRTQAMHGCTQPFQFVMKVALPWQHVSDVNGVTILVDQR